MASVDADEEELPPSTRSRTCAALSTGVAGMILGRQDPRHIAAATIARGMDITDQAVEHDVVRRPRDRKDVIARNAAALFAADGFNAVRMGDIAAATGITAGALYRHFRNKQELLSEIVNTSQWRYLHALEQAETAARASASRSDEKRALLRGLAAASLDSGHFAVLWQRESRYLTDDDRAGLRARLRSMAERVVRQLDIHGAGAESTGWILIAVLSSPGHHVQSLPRLRLERLLVNACYSVLGSAPAAFDADRVEDARRAHGDRAEPAGSPLLSRREQLLEAAARQFQRLGYSAVGINDIAAEAGMAGPAIYRHFGAKAEILVALVERFHEWNVYEARHALRAAASEDPEGQLRRLVHAYVTVALAHPDLVAVVVTEWLDLPDPDRDRLQRLRNDLVAEWHERLLCCRRDLDRQEAMLLVRTAMVAVEDTVRIPHLLTANGPALSRQLEAVATSILLRTPTTFEDDRTTTDEHSGDTPSPAPTGRS
ncbi:TetR family transcriptional regulator Mce3R [Pseudonocardia ailaonensis]|uniref:TetR family transcriptional regulator Mce3R n=1 Tax=Pseudonocardia ailaonensis TaxID=367279 RepID=A0ABN2N5E6_9PSEU